MPSIDKLREKIDNLDNRILEAFSERGKLAKEIGALKQSDGAVIHVPSREKSIYDRLLAQNKGPYKNEAVLSVFREIISATRALEAPIRVAYLGPAATFTQMAAVQYFGTSAELVPAHGIENIFKEVEKGQLDYGVVPIENSTEGVVSHTLDMFSDSNLKVCAEVIVKVCHHLMSKEEDPKAIKVVYSHPQALAQCRQWLLANLPWARLSETNSTAAAAEKAARESGSAAIAAEIAANVYEVPILNREIQDQVHNFTRFLVIGPHISNRTGSDKTSALFTIRDEIGGLYKILGTFAREKVNLSKIESRPLKKKAWEYIFFVDLEGHVTDKRIARALKQVEKKCVLFKVLGSYPKSTPA